MQAPLFSIVSPVYKAENLIHELITRLEIILSGISDRYEIILVEDGSPDGSWKIIEDLCKTNPKIKGIKLSRNFGQHYAITAGLDHVSGEWIVVMDCDLQDRPEEIPELYRTATEKQFDIVLAKREERRDTFVKRLSSKLFYGLLSYLTGTKQDASVANFGIYHKTVIESLQKLREPIRYFPTMIKWVGFQKTYITVEHGERFSGATSYNWKKLFALAIDIILANSDKPIRLIVKLGLLIAIFSFGVGLIMIYKYFTNQITVAGYTSILVSIWFIGGMILSVLGLIGLYIGKIFEGVKQRPIYIKAKELNIHD